MYTKASILFVIATPQFAKEVRVYYLFPAKVSVALTTILLITTTKFNALACQN